VLSDNNTVYFINDLARIQIIPTLSDFGLVIVLMMVLLLAHRGKPTNQNNFI